LDSSSKVVPSGKVLYKTDSPMKKFDKKKKIDGGKDN